MKKLILSTAIVLGGLTAATAQDKEPTAMNEQKQTAVEAQVESRIEAAQDVDAVVETEATVATDAETAEIAAADVAQDYKEVKASEVPQESFQEPLQRSSLQEHPKGPRRLSRSLPRPLQRSRGQRHV